MKKTGVSVLAVFVLFFFASTMQAQNNSAANSDVIISHEKFSAQAWISCPSTGVLVFDVELHILTKMTPSGKWSHFLVANGEGVDDSGGIWKWHDTWNQSEKDLDRHVTRVLTVHGPGGKKLQLKGHVIIKDGEEVKFRFDPLCE